MSKEKSTVDSLQESLIELYHESDPFPFQKIKKVSLLQKLWNERRLKRLVDKAITELDPFMPAIQEQMESDETLSSEEMEKVKKIMTELFKTLDKQKLLFDEPFLMFFIDEGYMNVAEAFVKLVRKTDSQLTNEEIFQALRNIWIMNSLQIYWGLSVELTTPMVAYSLLYPYTDNFLDDASVDVKAKKAFNNRLSRALAGETVSGETLSEKRIFSLVKAILNVYPKETYPEVAESIQFIHQAQIESMKQCDREDLSKEDVLSISLYKGGTSVLADACLLKGKLSEKEKRFAYYYGAFLQLLDDLQDVESDRAEGNQTLFSKEQTKVEIEAEIGKLISLIISVNSPEAGDTAVQLKMKRVISNCTMLMIMETVGKKPDLVSSSFYKELEAVSRVRLKTYSALETKIKDLIDY